MVMLNDQIYELFAFASGGPYDSSPDATFDAGRVLGQFHKLAKSYQSDWEPSRRGYHDSSTVRTNLNGIPSGIGSDDSVVGKETELLSTVTGLYDAYDQAAEKVNDHGYLDWTSQIVHADWHPGNMLFRDNVVRAVIDYDSLRLLPPVTDLANGALQFSILGGPIDPLQWPAHLDEDRLRRFLLGYEGSVTTQPKASRALPWLMIEALIAEAVVPIAATGSFGRLEGFRFLKMIRRKVAWLEQHGERLITIVLAS